MLICSQAHTGQGGGEGARGRIREHRSMGAGPRAGPSIGAWEHGTIHQLLDFIIVQCYNPIVLSNHSGGGTVIHLARCRGCRFWYELECCKFRRGDITAAPPCMQFSKKEADNIAAGLQSGEWEGWSYKAEGGAEGAYTVAVYDPAGAFVGRWQK